MVHGKPVPPSARTWCFRCVAFFTLRFPDPSKERSFLQNRAPSVAFGASRCCILAAILLVVQRAVDVRSKPPALLASLGEPGIVAACCFASLAFFFAWNSCTRSSGFCKVAIDEVLAALAGLFVLLAMSSWSPLLELSAVLPHEDEVLSDEALQWASVRLGLSLVLALLLLATMPLRSSIFSSLLIVAVVLSHMLDDLGIAFKVTCMAVPFLYALSRSRENTSRQRHCFACHCEELAMALEEKEREARSNMTLARGMQSLAGRRCDMVLVLTSQLAVWRSTALQDLFFKQDMDGTSILDVLPAHEHGPFMTMAQRVREHKAGESMPLTLPRGYAKIILEYAGNEEDRYVMSVLLDESSDDAFRNDACAPLRISSSKGYDPSKRAVDTLSEASSRSSVRLMMPLSQLGKVPEDVDIDADSLAYSVSLKRSMEAEDVSDVGTFTTMQELASEWDFGIRRKGCEAEVQVGADLCDLVDQSTQTDLQFVRDELTCSRCKRARPPRPPRESLPVQRRSPSRGSLSSRSSGGSSHVESDLGTTQNDSAPPKLTFRLTAPCWPETGNACLATSIMWLIKHWNFGYLAIQCCPYHAALGIAFQTLKRKKKDCCNPLWSPFTGWQCEFCTAMNHPDSNFCDLCATARGQHPLSAESSRAMSDESMSFPLVDAANPRHDAVKWQL